MNWQDVAARVDQIEKMSGDDEAAHSAEDRLWQDVLEAIATGEPGSTPQQLATEALHTRDLDFTRWCA